MNIKDKEILLKILKHAKNIEKFCRNCCSEEDFKRSEKTLSATAFELLQIGELAKIKLSIEAKENISDVPWESIYGLRNRIVHGYSEINHTILWSTIKNDIPSLINDIQAALEKEKPRRSIKEQLKEAEDKAKEHNAKLDKTPKKDKGLSR